MNKRKIAADNRASSDKLINFFIGSITSNFSYCIFQHRVLLVKVVDGLLTLGVVVHRTLQEEAQEALDAVAPVARCQVHKQTKVKTNTTHRNK